MSITNCKLKSILAADNLSLDNNLHYCQLKTTVINTYHSFVYRCTSCNQTSKFFAHMMFSRSTRYGFTFFFYCYASCSIFNKSFNCHYRFCEDRSSFCCVYHPQKPLAQYLRDQLLVFSNCVTNGIINANYFRWCVLILVSLCIKIVQFDCFAINLTKNNTIQQKCL